LEILDIKAYKGRNIYSHHRVVKMIIDLKDWDDVPTCEIPKFNQSLAELLPGLHEHYCSLGYPGGFIKRLEEGTYLAHVIEHTALEILNELGYNVTFGKARRIKESSQYTVVYAYENEYAGLEAGKLAVDLIRSLCNQQPYDLKTAINEIKEKAAKLELGPSTQAIVDAALERGIPVMRIGRGSIIQLGYGKYQKRLEATITDKTSCIAVDIACDKSTTKEILIEAGIPVPNGSSCSSPQEAVLLAQEIGYPVVVKPERGNQGRGVSLNLLTSEEVIKAYNIASKIDENVIVERYVKGNDYRVLVVGDQVVAVSQRIPAHVVGDGVHSIRELVEAVNADPRRGNDHEKPLTKIVIDEISINLLEKQGYTLDSIPKPGKIIRLKENGNISTGGEAIDCTEKIHPLNQEIAIRAARVIGLDVAGIDISCEDIGKPITETGGAVIEVNAAPGIRMHLYPSKGKPRKVANHIVDLLYPSGSRHSIPIISITGTNGKTTTTRMVAHILKAHGMNVGMTVTGGVYINDRCILKGDTTGPASARMILMDKSIDVAVLETARGGIIRSGLAYDLSDIGVLTNISEDHLGIDGIDSLEELLHVKSLVIEAIKTNGYAVLNADDPMAVQAAQRTKSNIIYFSKEDDNLIIHKHLAEGGIAVFLKNGYITIATGESIIQSLHVSGIPATYGGKLVHNIENSLTAVAVAYAMKIPLATIEKALASFNTDEFQNPGRFNIFNVKDFRVVIDYGHNIAGYQMIGEAVKKMGASRLVGIIGVPGDRQNDCIKKIGFIAGEIFDKIIIKEDMDLRGRVEGEVSRLLLEGAISSGMERNQIEIIRNENQALEKAMMEARAGDLIVVFYENLEGVLETLKRTTELIESKNIQTEDKINLLVGRSG